MANDSYGTARGTAVLDFGFFHHDGSFQKDFLVDTVKALQDADWFIILVSNDDRVEKHEIARELGLHFFLNNGTVYKDTTSRDNLGEFDILQMGNFAKERMLSNGVRGENMQSLPKEL